MSLSLPSCIPTPNDRPSASLIIFGGETIPIEHPHIHFNVEQGPLFIPGQCPPVHLIIRVNHEPSHGQHGMRIHEDACEQALREVEARCCVEALEGDDRARVSPHFENKRVRGAQVCVAALAGKG
jgi:hypothetical protein